MNAASDPGFSLLIKNITGTDGETGITSVDALIVFIRVELLILTTALWLRK